jgi:uncharacterized membrane protein
MVRFTTNLLSLGSVTIEGVDRVPQWNMIVAPSFGYSGTVTDISRRQPSFLSVMFGPLSSPGLVVGLVLLWFSLGSSLLPRSAMMQGVVSALSLAIGYAVGVLVWRLVRWVSGLMSEGLAQDAIPSIVRWIALAGVAITAGVAIVRWPSWQTAQGELVGVDPLGIVDGFKAVGWAIVFFAVLLGIARIIRWVVWSLDVFNARHMSVHVARGVTVLILVALVGGLYYFIASSGLTAFANARFAGGDTITLEGVAEPTNPEVSGSPDSLVEWDDLGYQGRTFAGAPTTVDDMASFYGSSEGIRTPIRVYAGLNSAATTQERAQLVVDELIRTNAQDRAVLMLVATTGTGWVDPLAAAALEYMYKGDTAIAAMQYSFLPSWISFILDTATAMESGIAVNDAVIEWWAGLPADDRPRLVAFGESLGSLGSEAAYAQSSLDESLAYVQSNVDGALWVGPTDANPIRQQLLIDRTPSSPVWKPVYNDGAIVRLENEPGSHDPYDASWNAPRVVYYHHASDPVGYWNWETLWKPQEWTDKPVGPDVPDSVRWIPFTTFTQVVVDLINGFSASVGHGHNYNDVFVEGWSVVAPSEGWTAADTDALQAYLDTLVDLPGL